MILPSQLPDIDRYVAFDTETKGLHPDDGQKVTVVSVTWSENDRLVSHAFPFGQGLYGKPEYDTAFFGWAVEDVPTGDFFKTGVRKGEPKTRRVKRKVTADEILEPDPSLTTDEWLAFCRWLETRKGLITHNGLFDVLAQEAGCLRTIDGPSVPGPDVAHLIVWDTMWGQRIVDPQHSVGLKESSERVFGVAPEEEKALSDHLKSRRLPSGGSGYHLADWSVISPYATGDTERTLRLAQYQWQKMRDSEEDRTRMTQGLEVMRTLIRMEQRGVPYKAKESLAWASKLDARVDQLADELPFTTTPAGVRQFFFTKDRTSKGVACLGLKPIKTTEKGEVSVDKEVMGALALKNAPQARKYQEFTLSQSAVRTYYRGYAEKTNPVDGRLRTRFKQTVVSGRLSCERVNLQAIPHDHRMLGGGSDILAEAPSPRDLIDLYLPGFSGWEMDLAQAELRVAAMFARCKPMLEIINEGRDPHGETATALFQMNPGDPDWDKYRNVAKRGNFSLIFGVGPDKFRADLRQQTGIDLGTPATRKLHRDWNELYPEFGRAIKYHMDSAQRDKWTLVRGNIRRWYSEREIQYRDFHKGFNQKVQGNLGEFGKEWMVQVDHHLMDAGVPNSAGLLLQIHDSLVVMVPTEQEHLVEECADIARNMWPEWFPQVPGAVDVKRWQAKH